MKYRSTSENTINNKLLFILLIAAFSTAFYRTAWVAEDAFITFRVIDNTLNGLGLVWNPGERVQAFTHPLWFFLLLPLIEIFKDPYYVAISLSYGLLLCTFSITWKLLRDTEWRSWLAFSALLWSHSFIDYSSSGLENPLIHFFAVLFIWIWIRQGNIFLLSLVGSALFLCRPDAIILIAPSIIWQLFKTRNWHSALLGISPAAIWTLFSLFYYGTPVPNTALAKVGTDISLIENFQQALKYFQWVYDSDPVTLAILFIGTTCGFLDKKFRPLSIGIILFIAYLFYVGADYMGGRFLSYPALVATLLMALSNFKIATNALLTILIYSIGSLSTTIFSPTHFMRSYIINGIADERGFYYQNLGLSPVLRAKSWRTHSWFREGELEPGLYTRCAIGMAAYSGGPHIQWIDRLALTEPFLARLPSRTGVRVGHYERAFPDGFLESKVSNENLISDENLRKLYDDVTFATKHPLFAPERWGAIWRLNTGFHKNSFNNFDRNSIGLPGIPVETESPLSCYGLIYGGVISWKIEGIPASVKIIMPQQNP